MDKEKRFFHELSKEEYQELFDIENMTWEEVREDYKQPDWCCYPVALDGEMGCWGLWGGTIKSTSDCEHCEYFKENYGKNGND